MRRGPDLFIDIAQFACIWNNSDFEISLEARQKYKEPNRKQE